MALEVAISAGLAVIAGSVVSAFGANQQWALAAEPESQESIE